jgi:hypothetical protein
MIKYALKCDHDHGFESWFPDIASYETQVRRGLVACPECGSIRVEKALMAPALLGGARKPAVAEEAREAPVEAPTEAAPVALLDERSQALRVMARELRRQIVANTVDVGRNFPDEARAIHAGDAPERAIRGEATPEEARALIEEGIGVTPLPSIPDERN